MDYKELKQKLLSDPKVKEEYEKLEPVYQLVSSIIKRRSELNLTQKELAARLNTTQSSISRLENLTYCKHSISTLQRVADALDAQLIIRLEPKRISLSERTSPEEAEAASSLH